MSESIERVFQKGPVKLTIRVTPSVPRLSDIVDMEIEVHGESGVEIIAPTFGQAVGDFVVRDYSEIKGRNGGKNETNDSRRFQYKLEPAFAGLHLIRSLIVDFIDHRQTSENKDVPSFIESEPIEVKVTSELGDNVPDLAQLEPIMPPRPLDSTTGWIWLVMVPLVIILASLAWLYRRRREVTSAIVIRSAGEIAREALDRLLAEKLPDQGLFQEFYLRLTSIVRHYIEGTTGVRAPEQTTEEFLRDMHRRGLFESSQSSRLQDFLQAADMVKYAGQQPTTDQIATSIDRAREFIEIRTVLEPTTATLVEAR